MVDVNFKWNHQITRDAVSISEKLNDAQMTAIMKKMSAHLDKMLLNSLWGKMPQTPKGTFTTQLAHTPVGDETWYSVKVISRDPNGSLMPFTHEYCTQYGQETVEPWLAQNISGRTVYFPGALYAFRDETDALMTHMRFQ